MEQKSEINVELEHAERARALGQEGKARVCARRAAGIAARLYLSQHGRIVRTPSAYDVLKLLMEEPSLAPELRQAAEHLTLRVDEDFKLPAEVDLISEARRLCASLLRDHS